MKKIEHQELASQWREEWNRFFEENPEPTGLPEDWQMETNVLVTCTTDGCSQQNKTHRLTVGEQLDGLYRVWCAGCSSPIEDVDPMYEDDEEFRLPVRREDGTLWTESPRD